MDGHAFVSDATSPRLSRRRRVIEPLLVVLIASVWFFWGTHVGHLLNTETLRALVAKEMYEGQSGLIPTVHGRTYLRKLPLHAWTTAGLGRLVGRFDEDVVRWPSAALGVLFVLTMYYAGRWMVDPRAGPAAAVLAGGNIEVLEYGTRADLDIGVLVFTSLAVLLLIKAWMSAGRLRTLALAACYLFALVGSLWKAPHVLLTVWLALAGLIWIHRREPGTSWRRFAFHPIQIAGSLFCLAIFAVWFLLIAREVSPQRAGGFVLIEFLARVVPHRPEHLLDILMAVPQFIFASFPACLLAALLLRRDARQKLGADHGASLWGLAAWLIPTAVFLMVVPAKAVRYWFIAVGAVTLLGAMAWRAYSIRRLPPPADETGRFLVRVLLIIAFGAGVLSTAAGIALLAGWWPPAFAVAATAIRTAGSTALLTSGVFMIGVSLWGWAAEAHGRRTQCGVALTLAVLALKPIQVYAFLPARSASSTIVPDARRVDELVPEGRTVFVLSDRVGSDRAGELADFGFYCERTIRWPEDVEEALARCDGEECFFLVRKRAFQRLQEQFGDQLQDLALLRGDDKELHLAVIRKE